MPHYQNQFLYQKNGMGNPVCLPTIGMTHESNWNYDMLDSEDRKEPKNSKALRAMQAHLQPFVKNCSVIK